MAKGWLHSTPPAALEPDFLASKFLLPSRGEGGKEGPLEAGVPWGVTARIQSLSECQDNSGNPVGLPPVPRGDNGGLQYFWPFLFPWSVPKGVWVSECLALSVGAYEVWHSLDTSS